MKKEIASYVARCDTCRKVKADHLRLARPQQPLSIWVIVDQFTKSAHFLPVRNNYRAHHYAELYLEKIVCLHGVPKTIVLDRGSQFMSRFWEHLHKSLGTKLIRSSAYHPQTDGQTEWVNQILKNMLRACVLTSPRSWDKWLSLA